MGQLHHSHAFGRRFTYGRQAFLLHHHAHLLRQRRPAPGHRLLHDHVRRAGALPSRRRLRRQVPDRPRRARPEGGGGSRGPQHDAAGLVRFPGPRLHGHLADARDFQRRLHPHDAGAPGARGPVPLGAHEGVRLHLQGQLRRLVLRARGDLLHRDPGRQIRRGQPHRGPAPLPRLRPSPAARAGGELVLQAFRLPGPAPQVLR